MKISEAIEKLEKIKQAHGDIEFTMLSAMWDVWLIEGIQVEESWVADDGKARKVATIY